MYATYRTIERKEEQQDIKSKDDVIKAEGQGRFRVPVKCLRINLK